MENRRDSGEARVDEGRRGGRGGSRRLWFRLEVMAMVMSGMGLVGQ